MANDAELKIQAQLDDKLTEQIRRLVGEVQGLSTEAKKAFDSLAKSADKAAGAAGAAGDAIGDVGKTSQTAGDQVKKLGDEGAKTGEGLGESFKKAALQIVSVSTAVTVLTQKIKEFLTTSTEVEVINARIQASLGSNAAGFEKVERQLTTLALQFKNFVTEQEVASAAQVLLQKRFATTADVVQKVTDAATFARVQNITLAESVNLLTNVNGAFADASNNSVDIFSKLRLVSKETSSDFRILSTGFDRIGDSAIALGVRLEDVLAAFTVLRQAGQTEAESLRGLDAVLKGLRASSSDIEARFKDVGRTFDAQTLSVDGLSTTLGTLVESIRISGGDVQAELRKIFGSQDVVNTAVALGVTRADQYDRALAGLSGAAKEYNKDLAIIGRTQESTSRAFFEFFDVIDNARNTQRQLSGETGELNLAYQNYARAAAQAGIATTEGIVSAQERARLLLSELEKQVTGTSKVVVQATPEIESFYRALSGESQDAELEKIKKFADELRKEAAKFKELGLPEFSGKNLTKVLEQIAATEERLTVEVFARREEEFQKSLRAELARRIEAEKAEAARVEAAQARLASVRLKASEAVSDFISQGADQQASAFDKLDTKIASTISRLEEIRSERAKLGEFTPADAAYFAELEARVLAVGEQVRASLKTQQAQEIQAFFAQAFDQIRIAGTESLDAVNQEFARLAVQSQQASTESSRAFLEQARALGISSEAAADLNARLREIEATALEVQQIELLLTASLQVEGVGEQDLLAGLRAQLAPLSEELNELLVLRGDRILSDSDVSDIDARIAQVRASARDLSQEAFRTGEAFDAGFGDGIASAIDKATNKFQQGVDLANSFFNTLGNSFATLFNDIVLGTKDASDAIKDFVKNFIAGIVQAINQLIAFEIAASILRGLGFASGAAGAAGGAPVPAGEKGGVMPGNMLGSTGADVSGSNLKPMGGASFFADGGVMQGEMEKPKKAKLPAFFADGGIMAGTMLAAASGLPMRAYAKGGVTTEPQVAVFGEGPGAEAFVPLPGPNRGIPVEFQNTPSSMSSTSTAGDSAPTYNIVVEYNPSIQALDGQSTRDVLLREARIIGDIVASEIATGANRGLKESVRATRS
jgi:TP901 family phage tail tape measure protein